VLLETKLIGGVRVTSVTAVQRFMLALENTSAAVPPTVQNSSTRTDVTLSEIGI